MPWAGGSNLLAFKLNIVGMRLRLRRVLFRYLPPHSRF